MRRLKEVQTALVSKGKVQQFFSQLSEAITSECDSIWVAKEKGIVEFLVGNERIRVTASKIKKGGLL